jgi:presequence protease
LTKNIKITPCEEFSTQSGVNGFIHDISTNGIMYLDFCFDLHQVPERLLSLVPLFSRSLLLMGNRNEDYSKLIRKIGIHTGGIRLVRITGSHFGNRHAESKLTFRIKLTYAKMDKLKDILASLFTGINWDNRERFNQILLEEKSEYEAGIVPSGHSLVLTRIRSTLSEADWIQEQFGGVSYLQFLRSACERMDSGWDDLCADLQQLYKLIINRKALLINVTTDRKQCRNYNSYINELVSLIPERELGSDDWKFSAAKRNQILATSTQVNYIGTGFALPDNKFNPGGALAVIRKSIGTDYLWNLIRVQGGAYGGFASFDDLSRIFALVSYRDPQFSRTYEVYQKLADYLLNFSIAPEELERIKISVIGDLDMPLLPDALGFISFRRKLLGVNDGYRQQYRDNVFAATEQHFHEFGQIVRSGLENAVKVAMCREDVFMESGFTESDFDIIRV